MEKKERIADLLRAEAQSEAAERFLGAAGAGRVRFSDAVELIVDENFGLTGLQVRVSWSAQRVGAVDVAATRRMIRSLQHAATLAGRIQAIIDEEPTS